ncbi:MAG: hypothetical protein AAGB11_11745, partial [Pseudomonadota bacterium]
KLILPTGNLNLERCCASIVARDEKPTCLNLDWFMAADDATSSHLEVWVPYEAKNLKLTVTEPGGDAHFVPVTSDSPQVLTRINRGNRSIIARATQDTPRMWGGPPTKTRIALAFAPTAPVPIERAATPVGRWKVEVTAEVPTGKAIEAWVQRDASHIGHNARARQSILLDEDYQRYDHRGALIETDDPCQVGKGGVQRTGTVSGTATAAPDRHTIVVGAYQGPKGYAKATPYTATSARLQRQPDYAGFADRSALRRGIIASGTRSGSRNAMSGTSVAVPSVARVVVDILQCTDPEKVNVIACLDKLAIDEVKRIKFRDSSDRCGKGPIPLSKSQRTHVQFRKY